MTGRESRMPHVFVQNNNNNTIGFLRCVSKVSVVDQGAAPIGTTEGNIENVCALFVPTNASRVLDTRTG